MQPTPHGPENERHVIAEFLRSCSVEVTPGGAQKIEDFRSLLKPRTTIYVTFLSGSDFSDTVRTVRRLHDEGMNPVPHFAARLIPSRAFLEENLRRLQGDAAVTEALLIGGGVSQPVGEFDSSIQVLRTDLFQKYGIHRLGVAGHPEGSPDIPDAEIAKALAAKNAYAKEQGMDMYIATQFVFESGPIIAWDRKLRELGNELPVHIGIPGLATIKTLIKHAQACGIGPSIRVLTRQAANIARLMTTRMPDELVRDLANYTAANPSSAIRHCHLYPLGGLHKSVTWLYAVQDGEFELNPDGGFRVLKEF
jgi:methylenetetrahydrofolate reductase (NADPH)